jgi:hypothetical protein
MAGSLLRRRCVCQVLALAALIAAPRPAVARAVPADGASAGNAEGRGAVTVSVTPGRPVATFRPDEALGAAVDGPAQGDAARL